MSASIRYVPLAIFLIATAAGSAWAEGPAPAASAAERTTYAPPKAAVRGTDRFDEVTREMVSRANFQGVVLVARGDHVLLERGYGPASLDGQQANNPQLCYWLGSVTKQFTAAAVLRLVDQGRLGLDDPLRVHLPDTPSAWAHLTVRQLLSHTAGVPSNMDFPNQTQPVTPQALWERIKGEPLDFEPGTAWRYSNAGFAVLGLLIEAMTGRSYGADLQTEFFGPLGMTHTGELGNDSTGTHCAPGLVRDGGTLRAADPIDPHLAFGASNLVSTTSDLLRWQRALYGGSVLTPASLKAMTTPIRNGYALGLDVDRVDGRLRYQHHGAIDGFSTHLVYAPKEALTVVVLSNEQGAATGVLAYKLLRVALGQGIVLPGERRVVALQQAEMAGLPGTYTRDSGETAWVVQRGHELWSRMGGQPWMHLEAGSRDVFFSQEQDVDWQFERTGAGGTGAARALRVPELSGSRRWIRSAAPPLDVASQAVYLRGTMNNWGQSLPMTLGSDGLLHLSLQLPAGAHRLKLASADWSHFDWGGAGAGESMPVAGRLPLVQGGSNLTLTLAEPAICKFSVDGRDIFAPSLAWACTPE